MERTCQSLQKNLEEKYVDQPFSLILNKASSLTEDLEDDPVERGNEELFDVPIQFEKIKRARKKRDYANSTRRRSARIKIQVRSKDA